MECIYIFLEFLLVVRFLQRPPDHNSAAGQPNLVAFEGLVDFQRRRGESEAVVAYIVSVLSFHMYTHLLSYLMTFGSVIFLVKWMLWYVNMAWKLIKSLALWK